MRTPLIVLFFFHCGLLSAQYTSLSFSFGVGTYKMTTQKTFQHDFRYFVGLPLEKVDEFPPFFVFGGSFVVRTSQRGSVGTFYEFTSTGGRIHYKDYSGYALMDQLLRSNQFGLFYQHHINKSNKWRLFVTGHSSVVFTNEEIKTSIALDDNVVSNSYEFRSTNFGFRPGLMLQRNINRFLYQCNLGYEVQTADNLEDKGGETVLQINNKPLTAQWTGFRLAISIGLVLNRSKESTTSQ